MLGKGSARRSWLSAGNLDSSRFALGRTSDGTPGGRGLLLQILALAAPTAWIATRYQHAYYFYDEWGVIDYVTSHSGFRDAFFNLNGHLWMFPYFAYKAQVYVFGLSNHVLIWTIFCASLFVWAVATRWLLRELDVPGWLATAGAIVAVYFGLAAQDLTFEVLLAANSAYGLGLLAAAAGLHWRCGLGAIAATGLLLLATGFDSSAALLVLIYVTPLLLACWHNWRMSLLLAVPFLAVGLWQLQTPGSPTFTAPFGSSLHFGLELILTAAGGLVASGVFAGLGVIAATSAGLLIGCRRRIINRLVLVNAAGAGLAVLLTTAAVAVTRSGVAAGHLVDFNRYLGQVAIFLMIGSLPVLWAVTKHWTAVRALKGRGPDVAEWALSVGLILVFFLNTRPILLYRNTFETWAAETRAGVAAANRLLAMPCPQGEVLFPDTEPLGSLSPQISVHLLQRLMHIGALPRPRPDGQPAPARVAVCSPAP